MDYNPGCPYLVALAPRGAWRANSETGGGGYFLKATF